ncbi:hypothetical protein [Nostoc sp. PA-18-2419]|uniref:hypothetical protein n=1 Tax=Nostoc sp. PA-18-2419 TaxID=2575443 RepID=UPI001CB8E997|nr:hypothetical protein [Nostoc sp. PA-18-2419]
MNYFRWRHEDAHRNALNAHCYWCLRRDRQNPTQATSMMKGLSVADKNEMLFQHGINFNQLPNWQKRGVGLYWEEYHKQGFNPITNETVLALRLCIRRDLDLPMKAEYSQFIAELVNTPSYKLSLQNRK